jgi:hypothetical protein
MQKGTTTWRSTTAGDGSWPPASGPPATPTAARPHQSRQQPCVAPRRGGPALPAPPQRRAALARRWEGRPRPSWPGRGTHDSGSNRRYRHLVGHGHRPRGRWIVSLSRRRSTLIVSQAPARSGRFHAPSGKAVSTPTKTSRHEARKLVLARLLVEGTFWGGMISLAFGVGGSEFLTRSCASYPLQLVSRGRGTRSAPRPRE